MALADGSSELDTVVMHLVGTGTVIKNWDHYRLDTSYLTPCDHFTFSVAADDVVLSLELLTPGADVEITINDRPVLVGQFDKVERRISRSGGATVTVSGRDILGPVVSSNIDPAFKFTSSLTLLDVAASVLKPFGITKIYNDGRLNVNAMTGAAEKPSAASTSESVQLPTLALDDNGDVTTEFQTVAVQQVGNNDLKATKIQQLKPHFGEGAGEYLNTRILARQGLHMSAMADGSGVIIDEPHFDGDAIYTFKRSASGNDANFIDAALTIDLDAQPSCILAQGTAAQNADDAKATLQLIMINELVGLDENANPIPEVQAIIARYKGAKVLTTRPELTPARRRFNTKLIARPMFLKDDESKTLSQLEGFVRHQMATHQQKALQVHITVEGHTQRGVPYAVDTLAHYSDERTGVDAVLWVKERTFEKSRNGGTLTHLTLILPHTIELGGSRIRQFGGKKTAI